MGRFEHAELQTITFLEQANFDPQYILNHTFGRFASASDLVTAKIAINDNLAVELEGRSWHPQQTISRLNKTELLITFPVSAEGKRPFYNLIEWVLSMGTNAHVIAPPQLKSAVATEIRAMAAQLNP